jgi:multiple sugar transport system ATP-binding protein
MGRAIVRRPQVFLMDEPLSNLDAKLRVQMRAEISRLQHNLGVTTIYVTHDQTEAMTMGDRVAVLSDGYLMQIDTPQNLYDNPDNLFVATFIGSPQMNLVLAAVDTDGDGVGITVGQQRLTIPPERLLDSPRLREYAGRDVIVGIRPEILEDAAIDERGARGATLPVQVLLREGLGSEVVVHARLDARAPSVKTAAQGEQIPLHEEGGVGIIARLDPRTSVALDAPATLTIELERLHFFDPETGLAIRS